MENELTIKSQGMKWGLILGLMSTIVGLVVNLFDLYANDGIIQLVSLALVLGALIFAFQEYKAANEGFMEFGEGFGMGMLILAISGVFSGILSYIYMKFIDTGIVERIKDIQLTEMESQGLSDEQIDMAMSMSEWVMNPEMMTVIGFVVNIFLGAIIALIVAAIMKNKKPVQL
ncbi:DUF4199 domain-containing protein [Hyphobacterium sp. CCMP332]|nr:DUF4199 domain-containing protein [Hyphobacterium sp. CCMP332]